MLCGTIPWTGLPGAWSQESVAQLLLSYPLPRIVGDVVRIGYLMMSVRKYNKMAVDTGMVVVIFIIMMYIVLVFGLLFYVKNDWCDLLFKNMTVSDLTL